MKHVIVGTGPAGVVAADMLRKLDPQCEITLIGDEPEPPYSRMAIPYYLAGKINESGTYLRKQPDYFNQRRIEIRHDRVDSVAPSMHRLKLQSGGELGYDKLLLATGSTPLSPPVEGVHHERVVHCWTLDDARRIARFTQSGSRVVLIGAGFIGCIILEALAKRGARLTVVEMGERMVPRMMDGKAGGLLKAWCEKQGITVLTGTPITGIETSKPSGDALLGVLCDGRSPLPADLVVLATGVKANVDFLDGSGIQVDQGIVVDRHLRTSAEDIYAAGDVAQGLDFSTSDWQVQAIQPTAADHALIAARNMAGRAARHKGNLNMNVLDTLGLISSSFGLWQGVEGGDSATLYDRGRYRYINLQFQEDVLVGATCVGHTDHIGVLRGLIQSGVHLNGWKSKLTQDPTRIMEAYLASVEPIGFNAGLL
ncbi:MAG: pyridine nucleotide-disulfide oxidoreductase [Methylothermaceae bacteria B42]|nr:MAG: pyridine nucleotide-disulfide oxidoreductase [Methylothermaceae bacteria B42]HHJ38564.1 NAD(P)/FAD-dependent oxidoreductase [Methylothermaceae bacterium]